ncbi:desaturase [Leisingera sp. ANG-M1]|uniref:sterol desaturase family protein n=1 Tax=Leisingera sp. ANG-M1 TaxID=1577895 RepID=UPI00057F4C1F|nr:sterol desaturase family protein [Leisingera sp. ANG-M1]KIC08848.1 desaturase [Leisingera sp. ANG-M1]
MTTQEDPLKAGSSREWNWHPDLPVAVTPAFSWPPRPIATLKWFAGNWLPITEYLIYALMAFATWAWLPPSLAETQELHWSWILQIWARNLILMTLFAQGLHVWLYGWKRQGDDFKYDRRGLARNNRVFKFNDQYWDNVFYALVSGVTIWTGFDVLMWYAIANGWTPLITFESNPVWFVALFLLMPVIQSFHFYWLHRALHIPFLYRRVHSVHHRSVSVAPWSGFSMHPVEHLGYMGLLLMFFVVPAHPVHLIFMGYWLALATATSHAGFENLVLGESARLRIGSFHHQLHHRYFECNYGNPEMPWDNWFGSYHDGSPEATAEARERKKQMYS